eukprot:TRINITY_DN122213_c0_g1_i1.p1 TRINITY_DN122213_c0_g1~~TRINITY_DN122213_c0_g1_i1.p1  ORF type:complete len:473 (-),score=96.50 TRINITY_DN122213_c0_g1_i1:10-1428(-)
MSISYEPKSYTVDTKSLWAKFDEFENKFKQLFDKVAEKFGEPDPELVPQEDVGQPDCNYLDAVRVEEQPGLGKVLVASQPIASHALILEEAPALVIHASAVERVTKMRETAEQLPEDFDMTEYEAHLQDVPEDIRQRFDGDAKLLQLYMVCRINGMQWGTQHLALCRTGSKAAHCCAPSAVFARKGDVSHTLHVKALRELQPGDQVTLTYLDDPDDLICCGAIRQRRLYQHRFFVCGCPRCTAGKAGDLCRGLPCRCGRTLYAKDEVLRLDAPRYEPAPATFSCEDCGQGGVEEELLALERRIADEFHAVVERVGTPSIAGLLVTFEMSETMHGTTYETTEDAMVFDKIDRLHEESRPLGQNHWLACRLALLKWRADAARARARQKPLQECTLLFQCVEFVELHCADLLGAVAAAWVAEAARYLIEEGPFRVLMVFSVWQRLEQLGCFEDCSEERWLRYLREVQNIDLDSMD